MECRGISGPLKALLTKDLFSNFNQLNHKSDCTQKVLMPHLTIFRGLNRKTDYSIHNLMQAKHRIIPWYFLITKMVLFEQYNSNHITLLVRLMEHNCINWITSCHLGDAEYLLISFHGIQKSWHHDNFSKSQLYL